MSKNLAITIIQSNLFWENKEKNITHFQQIIENLKDKTELIVLPEMFTTGFSMHPNKFAEKMDGLTLNWMQKMADESNSAIIGSLIIKENNNYFNRLIFAKPNSKLDFYDKRHLFGMAGEDIFYKAGDKRNLFDYKNWKIKALICYDLRFPVWSRNDENYDLLIYIANWPDKRIKHWKTLLKARAIENQSYTVGVNRIGKDGNDIAHSGYSAVYDSMGNKISFTKAGIQSVETIVLDKDNLTKTRNNLPFNKDSDQFEILL
ncbi:MAG: amidohydrolase [Bacteroidales bacterium]|nr:amidohydrolase [Bacteroidales bacterium]